MDLLLSVTPLSNVIVLKYIFAFLPFIFSCHDPLDKTNKRGA